MNAQMTYHARVERANRVKKIIEEIGIGQVIKEQYRGCGMGKPGRYVCITDTGITLIKDEKKEKIITLYVTKQSELVAVFGGTKKIPPFLRKKVDHNQSKFTKDGRTIWN